MYDIPTPVEYDFGILRDEISFANLIAIVNNPLIFESLTADTQQKLIQVLGAYTDVCVDKIMQGYSHGAKSLKERIGKYTK